MTNSTETERAELIAERAELVAKNEAATSWGAAVGARSERIVEIDRRLAALRSLAQDQKPVAWQWFYGDSWYTAAIVRDVCHALNEWADFACNASQWMRNVKDGISTPGDALVEMTANYARVIKLSRDADKALRHNAPPDTPAGKSAPLEQVNCAADHGGADAGVKPDGYRGLVSQLRQKAKWRPDDIHGKLHEAAADTIEALSHQPAPVAANASAEARLREIPGALGCAIPIWEMIDRLERRGRELNDSGVTPNGQLMLKAAFYIRTLSAHPHASDCDKQGERLCCVSDAVIGAKSKTCRVCGIEQTTKSEGGVEGHAAKGREVQAALHAAEARPSRAETVGPEQRQMAGESKSSQVGIESGPSEPRGYPTPGACSCPSDRTADVTGSTSDKEVS